MVHTFYCLGKAFMLDVESGSFYQIDGLTKKLVDEKNFPGSIPAGEFSRYSDAELDECVSELNDLVKEGALFSQEDTMRIKEQRNMTGDTYIKSMCLNISHKCNLRCKYCFADGGSYKGAEENMPLEVALKAIDFLIANSGPRRNLEVDFFGGEPVLNIDVVKKTVEYARKKEKKHNKNFRFTLTTNAYHLTDDIMEFLNAEMYNVVLSIDGRESVHNDVRKTVSGADSYAKVLENCLKFKKLRGDKQYYVRGTFTSKNKDFSKDVLALNDLGFDQISIEPVVLLDSHELAIKKSDIPEILNEYEVLATEYLKRRQTDKWFSFFHFNIDVENGPCEAKRVKSCGAGCEYVAVSPSGDMFPCHQFDGNQKFFMGNVLKNETADKNIKGLFSGNTVYNKPECANCWAKYHCSGGCAANSVNFTGALTKPVELSCELMKKRIECALAVYAIENE